jgi:hypothetical protein
LWNPIEKLVKIVLYSIVASFITNACAKFHCRDKVCQLCPT